MGNSFIVKFDFVQFGSGNVFYAFLLYTTQLYYARML